MLYFSLAFCACYARNVWHAQNFPFLSQLLFYENGTEYQQLYILNDDFTLNETKLEQQVSDHVERFAVDYGLTAFLFQGLPYYAASQTLYQLSRTAYIGSK